MDPVRVTANQAGQVIVPSRNNPNYGYIRVEQKRLMPNRKGKMVTRIITALVVDSIINLKRRKWSRNQTIDGKVIIKEQLTPFDAKNPDKDYKITSKTKIRCHVYGQPIYRKAFYDPDPNAEDKFIVDDDGNIMCHTDEGSMKVVYGDLYRKAEKQTV